MHRGQSRDLDCVLQCHFSKNRLENRYVAITLSTTVVPSCLWASSAVQIEKEEVKEEDEGVYAVAKQMTLWRQSVLDAHTYMHTHFPSVPLIALSLYQVVAHADMHVFF